MVIPMVVEKTSGGGERSYDLFSRLMKDNIVMLNSEINDAVAGIIAGQLLFLESQDPKKQINMYVNSGGGSINAGLAIINTMELITNPVSVVCMGSACSMGAVILCCGEPGLRFSLPDSSIMIHQPRGGVPNSVLSDMAISLKQCERLRDILYGKMAKRMGKSVKQIEKMCDRDCWFNPKEAVEQKIIDRVIERR